MRVMSIRCLPKPALRSSFPPGLNVSVCPRRPDDERDRTTPTTTTNKAPVLLGPTSHALIEERHRNHVDTIIAVLVRVAMLSGAVARIRFVRRDAFSRIRIGANWCISAIALEKPTDFQSASWCTARFLRVCIH